MQPTKEQGEVGVFGGVVKVAVGMGVWDRAPSPSPTECSQRRRRGEVGVFGGVVKVAVGSM